MGGIMARFLDSSHQMAKRAVPARRSCLCSTVSGTVEGSHIYEMEGFSNLVHNSGRGKRMYSDVFTVGGCDWAICLYPADHNRPHFSVFVALMSKDTQVTASFDLTLLDQSGGDDHSTKTFNDHRFSTIGKDVHMKHWGYVNSQWALGNSRYIKDDSLVFLCNIRVVTTSPAITIPPPNIGHCLKEILETGIASDIVFKVGDKLFNAHKVILAGRSEVFYAQFYGPLGNPKMDEILVEDIPPLVFKFVLDFIYSDSLPNFDNSESLPSPPIIVAQHLFAAADRFGLDRLKLFCETTLCDRITSDIVASTLGLADQHNCSHLKSSCLKFITCEENFGAVVKSDDFHNLEKSLLVEILQMMVDKISE